MFLDHGWLWVTETLKRKTVDKRDYCVYQPDQSSQDGFLHVPGGRCWQLEGLPRAPPQGLSSFRQTGFLTPWSHGSVMRERTLMCRCYQAFAYITCAVALCSTATWHHVGGEHTRSCQPRGTFHWGP